LPTGNGVHAEFAGYIDLNELRLNVGNGAGSEIKVTRSFAELRTNDGDVLL
jgi:hypothetical protein